MRKLEYCRELKDGIGSHVYGILVARSLDLGKEFMDLTGKYLGDTSFLKNKVSRYNSKVYVDSCFICGKRSELHTDHVLEQHLADKDGYIGNYSKDASFNLVVLCAECHRSCHSNEVSIEIKKLINRSVIVKK